MNKAKVASYMTYVSCIFSSANIDTAFSKGHFSDTIFVQNSNSTYINLKGFSEQLAFLLVFFFCIIDPRAQEAVRTSHSEENTTTTANNNLPLRVVCY